MDTFSLECLLKVLADIANDFIEIVEAKDIQQLMDQGVRFLAEISEGMHLIYNQFNLLFPLVLEWIHEWLTAMFLQLR